jgi:hypothetical protein
VTDITETLLRLVDKADVLIEGYTVQRCPDAHGSLDATQQD